MEYDEIERHIRKDILVIVGSEISYPVQLPGENQTDYETRVNHVELHNKKIQDSIVRYATPMAKALARYSDILTASKITEILPREDCRNLMGAIDMYPEKGTRVVDNFMATTKRHYFPFNAVIAAKRKIREEENEKKLAALK